MINRIKNNHKIGSSPLRPLELQQKENLPLINQHHPKPLISPRQTQTERNCLDRTLTQKNRIQHQQKSPRNINMNTDRTGVKMYCCNHPNKKAEFRTYVEEGQEYFCGRCAAQLATQGCKVQMLQSSLSQSIRSSKRSNLPHYPQYESHQIYSQILQILQLSSTIISQHNQTLFSFSNLSSQYSNQIDLTSAFYDRLIQIIEQMKTDHINDLIQERDKYLQIADIEIDNIRENIGEIENIKFDIEGNMEEVMDGIVNSGETEECRKSLEHYRQRLTLYRHQTEEQTETITQVTKYSQQQIDSMLTSFENFLKNMWYEDETQLQPQPTYPKHFTTPSYTPKQPNLALTVKNIHQILPRGVVYQNNESKRAFRNLQAQEDEIQELQQRKSPNFKKI